MKRLVTPEPVTTLAPNEIFVFGSNWAGRHGKGAAKDALKFGAKGGHGIGLHGQTYALPTKNAHLTRLSLDRIREQVTLFIHVAAKRPEKIFLVTAIGTGLCGYTAEQIAPFFR